MKREVFPLGFIKLEERGISFRLLDTAQMSGILVEWYDPKKGVLIGVTPQLENLACIMLLDGKGKIRIFFDQDRNKDKRQKRMVMKELASLLKEVLDIEMSSKDRFKKAMDNIVNG